MQLPGASDAGEQGCCKPMALCPHQRQPGTGHPGAAPAGMASAQSTQGCGGGWKSCTILPVWPRGSCCRVPGAAGADGAAVPTLAALIWARHTQDGRGGTGRSPSRSMVQVLSLLPEQPGTEPSQSLPITSPWAMSSRGRASDLLLVVKNTLQMPFLHCDPAAGAAASTGIGQCGPLGHTHSPICAGMGQTLPGDWVFLRKTQAFPLLGGCCCYTLLLNRSERLFASYSFQQTMHGLSSSIGTAVWIPAA